MKIATIDIETDGLLEECTQVWCAVVKDHNNGNIYKWVYTDNITICEFLSAYNVLIGHNSIAYDFAVLRKLYGWEFKGKKVDTLLMSRLQRPNRRAPPNCPYKGAPHSVEAWGYRLGIKKKEHETWTEFSPEMLQRCEADVEIQYLLYHELLREGKGEGWANAHKLNFILFDYLQKQQEHGWLMDQDHMLTCITTLNRWIRKIDLAVDRILPMVCEKLETKTNGYYNYVKKPFKRDGPLSEAVLRYIREGGSDSNIDIYNVAGCFSRIQFRPVCLDSNNEVKSFLLNLGWEPNEWNENNMGERTSPKLSKDDDFFGVQRGLGKLIVKRVQCKQRRGILEGWQKLIRPDGRISPMVGGLASTGRLRHKNIVNVPRTDVFFGKWMRASFIVPPGFSLVGVDSVSNHIRHLAAQMGDDEFTKSVLKGKTEDGTDVHTLNMKRANLPTRTSAKNFFYGMILFGARNPNTLRRIGIDVRNAKVLLAEYFDEMPKLKAFIEKLEDEFRQTAKKWYNKKFKRVEYRDGWIKGLDGRPILIDSEHKVLAYKLQSDEAIHMAVAYCWFHKQMEKRGYVLGKDYGTVIWMHDEIQTECKTEIADEVGQLCCEAITWAGEYFGVKCPHAGEFKIGKNWSETH